MTDTPNTSRYSGHDWRWVCSVLASPQFSRPRIPMVDTVLIERGRPVVWLSLAPDGYLQTRNVSNASTAEIFNAFTAFSLGFPRNRTERSCVAHYAVGIPQVC